MAPNTATAGKSYAQKAADLFMTAVGMKSATKPEPKEDAFAEEKLNPVALPICLPNVAVNTSLIATFRKFVKHSDMLTKRI